MIFLQLTETDKRVLFAIFLLLILVFVIIGYIGFLITRIMKIQGARIDDKVHDVVVSRVITNKKSFKKYAHRKNWHMFYKSAQIPIIILLIAGLCILIQAIVNGFDGTSIFDPHKGFSTVLFLWDFEGTPTTTVMGITIWSEWPKLYEDIGNPMFIPEAIPSYFAVPGLVIGAGWYLIEVQALIARGLRINKLCDSVFSKSLEGFNQNQQYVNSLNQQSTPQNNNPQPQQNETTDDPNSIFKL